MAEPSRIFTIHHVGQGLATLQEHRREDDVVMGKPVVLPVGTDIKEGKGSPGLSYES